MIFDLSKDVEFWQWITNMEIKNQLNICRNTNKNLILYGVGR